MAKDVDSNSVFPELLKVLESSAVGQTDLKAQVFSSLKEGLIKKSILNLDGSVRKNRGTSLSYLMEVIPLFEAGDFQFLLQNSKEFCQKFCFSPSRNRNSLYTKLGRKQLDDRYLNLRIADIYHRFCDEMGLSPYELPQEDGLIEAFLGGIVGEDPYEAEYD